MSQPVGDIVDQLKRAREARQRARNCLKAMQAAGYEAIKQQERFDSTDQKVRAKDNITKGNKVEHLL